MKTSNDWFDRTEILWNKHLCDLKIKSYLEIGVCEGCSMKWILENLEPDVAVGVDPWIDPRGKKQSVFDEYKKNAYENLDHWIQNKTVTLIEERSDVFFSKVIADVLPWRESFDLIYIDGDHGGYECMLDMMMGYHLLAKNTHEMEIATLDKKGRLGVKTPVGGMMVVDDLNRQWHFGKPLVKIATWQFELIMHGKMFKVWEDGRQCCFVRLE